MNKILSVLVLVLVVFLGCADKSNKAQSLKSTRMFQSVGMDEAKILQSGKEKMHCCKCGMKLPMFFKTNHAAKVDGKVKQYCSLHCLQKDINDGAAPKDIQVVDTNTLKFIPAKSAYYVVGSSKKGTMSMVSKYAFSKKSDALEFAKKFGGKVMSFQEALEVAKRDFKR